MYDCDIPVDGVAAFVFTTAERARDLAAPARVRRAASAWGTRRVPGCRSTGRSTTSWTSPTQTVARLWEHSGLSVRRRRRAAALRRLLAHSCGSGSRRSATARAGEAHRFVAERRHQPGATAACPRCRAAGAIGNGRMHGVPQMLECYLQLVAARRRAPAARRRTSALACHSSPHWAARCSTARTSSDDGVT